MEQIPQLKRVPGKRWGIKKDKFHLQFSHLLFLPKNCEKLGFPILMISPEFREKSYIVLFYKLVLYFSHFLE